MNLSSTPLIRAALLALPILLTAPATWAQAVDAPAAEALAKKSNCTKCHSVTAKKDGPPYKDTAAKYKGKADAQAKLKLHITSGPTIKIDGVEEQHEKVKSHDEAEIQNLIRWILSR